MYRRFKSRGMSLRELIIGFGFLSGIWLTVGINPTEEILNALTNILNNFGINIGHIILLQVLPIILFLIFMCLIYRRGGKLGLVAVACAFIGGLLILTLPILSVIFLFLGLGIGHFARRVY